MLNSHAIIVGMISPYQGEVLPTDSVLCINRAFVKQSRFSRVSAVYLLDDPELFESDVVKEVNELNCVVYNRKPDRRFRGSMAYPLDDVRNFFNGIEYFTCTSAYALAMCIMDGYEKITLHGMYHQQDSIEYLHHKSCMDFWCGMALGRGIDLQYTSDESILCKPMPWQPALYAYQRQVNDGLCTQTLACAYRACMGYPRRFVDAEDITREDNQRQKDMIAAMSGSV